MVLDNIFIKYNNLCEFWSGTLNKFQFVVYFMSAVTFFHGNGKELLGLNSPPTNSRTIISLCNLESGPG